MGSSKPRNGRRRAEADAALDFMGVLWAVDHALRSTSKGMNTRLGVTGPQRLVLRLVGKRPGISAGELAGALHVHPSTLTGVLERLARRKLILRGADPDDARRTVLNLTPRGRDYDRMKAGTVEAAVLRMLGSQQRQRVAVAREILDALVRELQRS
jgi:DNA-binding MarR family transcriptional regulator